MAGLATFSYFIGLLLIVSTVGRNIHQNNVNDDAHIIETSVKQILPAGIDSNVYNELVLSYWTPERMAAAKPMDLLMLDNSSSFNTRNHNSPMKTNNERKPVQINIPGVSPKSLKASPSVVGKVYGKLGTSNYVCSGSVVVSENGDTVLTAGHCVYDTDTQTWASDLIFVPAYDSGSTPYGVWVWRTAAIMRGWTQRDFNFDVAVVLLATSNEGQHVQDLTGALGMTVNKERAAPTVSYGYPVNIHRGEQLASCTDEAAPAGIPQLPTYEGMRLPCNMTGGSSGGPWTQEGTYQTSVNSFGIVGEDEVMYGPYFGDSVLNLWEQYQRQ